MISLNLLYKKSCQLLQISIYTQLRSKILAIYLHTYIRCINCLAYPAETHRAAAGVRGIRLAKCGVQCATVLPAQPVLRRTGTHHTQARSSPQHTLPKK